MLVLHRYNSTTYHDDMMWAATWLYDATRQPSYLNDAINYYVDHTQVKHLALKMRGCSSGALLPPFPAHRRKPLHMRLALWWRLN